MMSEITDQSQTRSHFSNFHAAYFDTVDLVLGLTN